MINNQERMRYVELLPPNPEWPELFEKEAKKIKEILTDNLIDIYHIGSTAIPNIYAKPIIDILPVVKDISLVDALNLQFEKLGYTCMGEYGIPGRRFYWKSKGLRTHHIHLFQADSSEIARHVAFRDFMREHPDYAQSYSMIKRCLAEVFPQDIENYVNGKASFVQVIDYKTGNAKQSQLKAEDNIILESYNPAWPKLAEAEISTIKNMIALPFVSIDHLGSTAVPELASKPIIDIFVTVKSIEDALSWVKPLETLGYVFWDNNPDKTHLRFFKGMPPFGEKRTHHIHIVAADDNVVEHRILFRDILRANKHIKEDYAALKMKLTCLYQDDREGYTNAKSDFIKSVLRSYGYVKSVER